VAPQIRFIIPVPNAKFGVNGRRYDTLVDALSFCLKMNSRSNSRQSSQPRIDSFLGFNEPAARQINPDDIILFSGGLDSSAEQCSSSSAREKCSIGYAQKLENSQIDKDAVVRSLIDRQARNRYSTHRCGSVKGDYEAIEYTQRTRSFLFVSLGMAMARAFDFAIPSTF